MIDLEKLLKQLKFLKDHRESIDDLIRELCPGDFDECDVTLTEGTEPTKCKYYPLCSLYKSHFYSMNDEDKEEYLGTIEQFKDNFKKIIDSKSIYT